MVYLNLLQKLDAGINLFIELGNLHRPKIYNPIHNFQNIQGVS